MIVPTPDHNTIIYLMFLNGILFLGLNFTAFSMVNPGPKGSKRIGYTLIVTVVLVALIQQEYQGMARIGFTDGDIRNVLLGGFVVPVFLISLVYYRVQRSRLEKKTEPPVHHENP